MWQETGPNHNASCSLKIILMKWCWVLMFRKISLVLWMEDQGFITSSQMRKWYSCSCLCHKGRWRAEIQLYWFLILTLDGGDWLALHPSCFIPGKEAYFPLHRRLGELVWMIWRWEKSLVPAGFEAQLIQPIA